MIPFLRQHEVSGSPTHFSRTFNAAGFQITGGTSKNGSSYPNTSRAYAHSAHKSMQKSRRNLKKKEQGWNSYIKPISRYNEQVHKSMRVPFEAI